MSTACFESCARRSAVSLAVGDRAACHALLNCLIKEFALPQSLLRYASVDESSDMPFEMAHDAGHLQAVTLIVEMPNGMQFAVLVDRRDSLGSQYYLSEVMGRRSSEPWRRLNLSEFASSALESCSAFTGHRNDELLEQVIASRNLMEAVVRHFERLSPQPLASYLSSEQCLWFGHPTHPAPKARLWPKPSHYAQHSPEFGAPARLHLVEVPLEGLWIDANGLSDQEVMRGLADQIGARPGHALLSLHPVQAEIFLQDPRVRRLLAVGAIKDGGRNGFLAYPTASVRTLYVDGHDYFIKGSLHLRITNCVRKNAWYELESTLIVDRILEQLTRQCADSTGGLTYVAEPAAVSWSPPRASDEDERWFREHTGVILRRNFCRSEGATMCLLAGTVFGRGLDLAPNAPQFLAKYWRDRVTADHVLEWFARYQALLLRPVLSIFFNHGVVFEPHLQNTILVHEHGWPVRLLLRDHEGVKLTAELGMSRVSPQTDARVRRSLEYSRAQGWNRIAYCLFVNNLSEAVLALTHGRPELASAMWQVVRAELQHLRHELQAPAPELDELIRGGLIPCKTNLRVRLAAAADKHAGYVQLRSPWSTPLS